MSEFYQKQVLTVMVVCTCIWVRRRFVKSRNINSKCLVVKVIFCDTFKYKGNNIYITFIIFCALPFLFLIEEHSNNFTSKTKYLSLYR